MRYLQTLVGITLLTAMMSCEALQSWYLQPQLTPDTAAPSPIEDTITTDNSPRNSPTTATTSTPPAKEVFYTLKPPKKKNPLPSATADQDQTLPFTDLSIEIATRSASEKIEFVGKGFEKHQQYIGSELGQVVAQESNTEEAAGWVIAAP